MKLFEIFFFPQVSGSIQNVGDTTLQPNSVDGRLDFLIRAFFSFSDDWNNENNLKVTSGAVQINYFCHHALLLYLLDEILRFSNLTFLFDVGKFFY